ncbi:hypothetical protein O181_102549 [Austropuccinia psidii MF-1]|uniref:Uncharacterized protein n=1 Tax=Austropuccinia psidii MF-1 TaxID=1389203 RepID=A0A9Q3PIC5_9BASI|nr:hypothetical protein [Austropuccinia psidii MF-1]
MCRKGANGEAISPQSQVGTPEPIFLDKHPRITKQPKDPKDPKMAQGPKTLNLAIDDDGPQHSTHALWQPPEATSSAPDSFSLQ